MVLGVLSVFIIIIVTLLITARTERLVSEAAQDSTRARHLVKTALADAMDYLDSQLWGLNNKISLPNNQAILVSQGTGAIGDSLHLVSGEVTNYLPRRYLWSNTEPDFNASNKETSVTEWIYISDPDQGNAYIGRYAYLCFDCTGLLDINLIATNPVAGQHRWDGTSIGEIDLSLLPDSTSQGDADNLGLQDNRSLYHRFDTLKEIIFLNDGDDSMTNANERDVINEPELNNLAPYSLCYDNGWWDWGSKSWETNGAFGAPVSVTNWTKTDAENVFKGLGHTAFAKEMALCFMDYIDDDFLPGTNGSGIPNVDIICGEPIPMINEVILSNNYTLTGLTLVEEVNVIVELWYPFVGVTNPNTYSIRLVSGSLKFSPTDLVFSITFPQTGGVTYQPGVDPQFKMLSFDKFPVTAVLASSPSTVSTGLKNYEIQIVENGSGKVVDKIKPDKELRCTQRSPAFPLTVFKGLSVNDPRLNHRPQNEYWEETMSPGLTNSGVTDFNKSRKNSAIKDVEGTSLYVRNGPMRSVAELGYIPTGEIWGSIDLFSSEGRLLLSRFRIAAPPSTPFYTNGLVNPNSLYPEVLTAIFTNTPIQEYPGQNPPTAVFENNQMIDAVVAGMLQVSENVTTGAGSFDSGAAWVTSKAFDYGSDGGELTTLGLNNMQKESIIRNTYELFNPNQNLFTIVLVAQVLNDQGDKGTWEPGIDSVVGEKRAVAVVWRDPFPNETGKREQGLQFFRWLDE